jgi:hypothetical protein
LWDIEVTPGLLSNRLKNFARYKHSSFFDKSASDKEKKVDNIFQQNQYEVPHLPVARYGQVYGEQHYPYGGRQHLVHY